MNVLDDKGRLFGFINLIDAFVILLLLAALVAVGVFLFGGSNESAVRYVTIEFDHQPKYVANFVSEGDRATYSSGSNLTITDVYVTPGDRNVSIIVRAKLYGTMVERSGLDSSVFTFAGSVLRTGSEIGIDTGDYSLNGVVTDIAKNNPRLRFETTEAVVELHQVDPTLAESLETGMTEEVQGRTLARITGITTEPSEVVVRNDRGDIFLREHPRKKKVTLELDLLTRQTPSGRWFHGERLRINTHVTLDFERITVSGRVIGIE